MAYIYMKPTADNYVNHEVYPEESTVGYVLLNEEVCDEGSTYIRIKSEEANVRITKSSSFRFSGANMPEKEFRIKDIKIEMNPYLVNSLATGSVIHVFTVLSNGLVRTSKPNKIVSSTTYATQVISFCEDSDFFQMFEEYAKANGKFPDVDIVVTSHYSSSKASDATYISRLCLRIEYDVCVLTKGGAYFSTWQPVGHIYRKTNGIWESVHDGRLQVRKQLLRPGHDLVEMSYKAPTCTATGLTAGCKCVRCGNVVVEQSTIPITSHTPTTVEASDATCVKDGYSGGEKCSICGAVISGSIIPATGSHTPTDVAATAPTCSTVGYTAGTRCSVCSTYLSGHETIEKDPNAHTLVETEASDATCARAGYTGGQKCSACGYASTGSVIPATGNHTWVDAGDGYAASQIDSGLTSRTICSVCGAVSVDHEVILWSLILVIIQSYPDMPQIALTPVLPMVRSVLSVTSCMLHSKLSLLMANTLTSQEMDMKFVPYADMYLALESHLVLVRRLR